MVKIVTKYSYLIPLQLMIMEAIYICMFNLYMKQNLQSIWA